MDREAYLKILKDADDPVHSEVPGGLERYDLKAAEARFRQFTARLQQVLGAQCLSKNGADIQDASFVGLITIPGELAGQAKPIEIRISHFGNLATVADEEGIRQQTMDQLMALLKEAGYRHIPSAVLSTPYTGRNPGVTGFKNWWHRYFDWI